jgi:hypothetical protein
VRRLWNLQRRYITEVERYVSGAKILYRLSGALRLGALALQERAQQTIEAAAVILVHGCKLNAHSLTRGDAADDTSRAHFNVSGGENQFNEATFRGRIRGPDKNSPEGDVFGTGDGSLDSYLPTDKAAFGCFDTGVTTRSVCVRRFGIRHFPSPIDGVTQSAGLARARQSKFKARLKEPVSASIFFCSCRIEYKSASGRGGHPGT